VVVLILAVAIGAPLESIADPATTSYTPVPEWFFLPLDELLVLVPQQLIPLVLVLPAGGVLLLLALPFIDRGPERNPFERPAVMVPGAFAILFVVILTLLGSGRLFNLRAACSPSSPWRSTPLRRSCRGRPRRAATSSARKSRAA